MKHSTFTSVELFSILSSVYSCIGTPLALKLGGFLANGDYSSIIETPMPDPHADNCFGKNYAAYNLLRKFDGFPNPSSTSDPAIRRWLDDESLCGSRNNLSWSVRNARADLHYVAMRKISNILGCFDPREFLDSIDHSGGASTQRRRSVSAIENKESDNHCITIGAYKLLQVVQREIGYYATPRIRNYSNFATVPKDALIDRPIIIENQGNMLLQKSIGTMIRKRLRAIGIDLNNQDINRELCKDLGLATIDLSSASDSIATSLVLDLLPEDWASVIFATRSPYVKIQGELHELQKIGGMGNGFVFELESLIFYAIVSAAIDIYHSNTVGPFVPKPISVYGDDIIVGVCYAEPVVSALNHFGFRVNTKKSFWTGPFRESCGMHVYEGTDITPIYLKTFDYTPGAFYHLYNSLSYLGERLGIDFVRPLNRIREVLERWKCFNVVPPRLGLRAGIHGDPHCNVIKRRYPLAIQGYRYISYDDMPVKYKVCQLGAYLMTLRKLAVREEPRQLRTRCWYITAPEIHAELTDCVKHGKSKNIRVSSRVGRPRFVYHESSVW